MYSTTTTYSPFNTTTTATPTPFTTTTTPTPTPTIVNPTISFSYNGKTIKEMTITVGDSIMLTYYVNNPSKLNLYYEHYNSNSYAASSAINYGYFVVNANNVGSTLIGITLKTGVVSTVGGGNVKVNVINSVTTTPHLTTTTSTTYIPTPTPTPDDLIAQGQPKPTLSPYEKSLVDKLANHISQILFDKNYK